MLLWLVLLALCCLLIVVADRAWLRHAARTDLPLHDPHGYLDMTARMTELCHGQRAQVEALIRAQRQHLPQASQAELVRLAMQALLAPQHSSRA